MNEKLTKKQKVMSSYLRQKLQNVLKELKDKLNKILADKTKQSLKKIQTDTERDFFMNAEEAVKYGIIDEVLKERK